MRFQEGDIVKISKKSTWYEDDKDWNPKDTEGSVCIGLNQWRVYVTWTNGESNNYRENELRLVRRPPMRLSGNIRTFWRENNE